MTPTQLAVAAVLSALHAPDSGPDAVGLPTRSDAEAMTRVVYNEARGKNQVCKALVVQTILNRHAAWNMSIMEVVYDPFQFDNRVPNPQNDLEDDALIASADAAVYVYDGSFQIPRHLQGVTHFHADYIAKPASWGANIIPIGEYCSMIWYQEMKK